MTPKEKAEQLVGKMASPENIYQGQMLAKQCALIAVDEILEATPHSPSLPLELMPHFSAMKYWQQVKQQIEKT